jgi:S1-C subfamily serine protease
MSLVRQIEAGRSSSTVHVGATAYLGIYVGDDDAGRGAVIGEVAGGGPAAIAGLEAGDTITALDGHAVFSAKGLTTVLLGEKAGAQVPVTYLTPFGASQTTTVTLGSGPPQ